MTAKRFENRLNKDNIKFNTLNPVWDNEKETGLNVFEMIDLMNELHDENQIKLEIVDAFIRGMEDEKGIEPENKEFQCRMNHTIRILKRLKEYMINPNKN